MEITILDRLLLLLTGLIAVYIAYRFYNDYDKQRGPKPKQNIYYIISFIVLFVAGVLIIFAGFDILKNPLISIVATILPFGIATGLIRQFYKKYEMPYLILMIIGLVAISLQQFNVINMKMIYPVFHSIAGLTIFFVPIMAVKNKKANKGFIWVTVGGAIIGIGGIALAFLGAGKPLLGIFTAKVVFTILTPILLLMALAFTFGFMKDMKNPVG